MREKLSTPGKDAVEGILSAIRQVVPHAPAALHEPRFQGNEWEYVKNCLDTGWVSSVGKFVDTFEEQLAQFAGVKRAIATVNGTAALHICLKLCGVRQGDEVLLPSLTFIATANAVAYCGAIPHFFDSEESTLGVDVEKLASYLERETERGPSGCVNRATGRPIRALIAMHTFGHPVDLDALSSLCQRFKIELIEDAAESLGSYYKGKHTGHWGRLTALSFNGNKIVTTGGGGAILTNDEELGTLAKHLTTTAKLPHKWAFFHDQTGFNYRLPNLNAALGCAQLEQLPGNLASKRRLAQAYAKAFSGLPGVRFLEEPGYAKSNYWLNTLILEESCATLRDEILERTNSQGIMTRPCWTLMHRLPMYGECPRMDLSQAESLERRVINIPSSAALGDQLG